MKKRRKPFTPEEQAYFASIKTVRPAVKADRDGFIHVLILGEHPHSGRSGRVNVVDGIVEMIAPLGIGPANMVRVEFSDGEACFAEKANIRILRLI